MLSQVPSLSWGSPGPSQDFTAVFQEPANAYEEARRGAYNPTYLYYTLGKLEIYSLREDYRKIKGVAYSLQTFHDEFVKQGSIPIRIIRRLLLAEDKAVGRL